MKNGMKNDIILFISIFMVLLLISGGTYAYWEWQSSNNPSVVFNTSKGIEEYIEYDAGDSKFIGNFQPSDTHCGGMSNTLSFSLKTSGISNEELEKLNKGILVATIKMEINSIESNIASTDYVHWALVEGDASSCSGTVLNTGTFNGLGNGTITLSPTDDSGNVETITVTSATQTFTVWIWIDGTISDNLLSSLSGETLDVNVWTQIDMLDVEKEPTE